MLLAPLALSAVLLAACRLERELAAKASPPPRASSPSNTLPRGDTKEAFPPPPHQEKNLPPHAEAQNPNAPNALPQKSPKESPPPADLGLTLELHAPRQSVLLGEPVVLAISVKNVAAKAILIEDQLSPEYGFLKLWIRPPGDQRERLYTPPALKDSRGKRPRRLPPGKSLSAWIPLYVGAEGWLLPRSGTYEVRAEYPTEKGALSAAAVRIEVKDPEGKDDRLAAELFMSREATLFFFLGGGEHLEGGKRALLTIAQDYPQSALAPYARLALGLALSRQAFDPKLKTFRAPDYPKAVEELTWALPRLKDPILAATGTLALGESLRKCDRPSEAQRAIAAFFETHPQARTIPGVAEKLEELPPKGK
jgi:hypothetical protein